MAFKLKSTEVITNNLEIKGKRSAGRLGKVYWTAGSNQVQIDVATGNHFVIDYEEIVLDPTYISTGYTAIGIQMVNRPSTGGQNNQVPGDYPSPYTTTTFGWGRSDCWEFTLLIKNLWSPKEGTSHSDLYGNGSNFYWSSESPFRIGQFALNDRIGTAGGEHSLLGDLRMKYGSDVLFKCMKIPNKYPGGGSTAIGTWERTWIMYPMMRNLF